jgi:hypothetical protein
MYINIVVVLMILITGMLIGYYFADNSWRQRKKLELKNINQSYLLLKEDRDRLEEINEVLVKRIKEIA